MKLTETLKKGRAHYEKVKKSYVNCVIINPKDDESRVRESYNEEKKYIFESRNR